MKRGLLPHLCELLLWHRLGQLVVELENSLEVVKNILTGNCVKTSERYHKEKPRVRIAAKNDPSAAFKHPAVFFLSNKSLQPGFSRSDTVHRILCAVKISCFSAN